MEILDKLTVDGTTLNPNGINTPPIPVGATDQSKLHDQYSINGVPNQPNKPTPSVLDLNGQVPTNNYRDNTPEGASF
tara:strand:- start:427 stop:657 length:231 start_codon:yes stop_codon:yes gene_type:complete